jgi:hypothetical protein
MVVIMSTQHTPGPWSERNGRIFQNDRPELTIANVGRAFDGDYSPANTRLIAAAPELLEALKLCQSNISSLLASAHPKVYGEWLTVVSAAIARSTGETK